MSEFQRGYNAGLAIILKLIVDNWDKRQQHHNQPNVTGRVKDLLGEDSRISSAPPPPPDTTYEAGKRAAFRDFLDAPVS